MLRFPLGLLVVLVLGTSVPAGALPRRTDAQQVEPSTTHQDGLNKWDAAASGSDARADGQEGKHDRSLTEKGKKADTGVQGSPSVEGAMRQSTVRAESQLTRSYLNGLVQASAAGKGNQVSNVAFVKTHKTASTTLAAIMYRYAVRHDLKLSHFGHSTSVNLESAAAQTKESRRLVDIMHYHITPKGQYQGTWDEAVKYYRGIMRHPDRINFITVLREPRSHLLSYYYYYIQPRNQLSIEEFLMNPHDPHDKDHELLLNPLSAEFGVRTAEGVQSLIYDTLPDFKLIMLTERLDEGLLVMRRMLHWHMIDLTYCDLNETKAGDRRWDGKPFVDRPHFDSLPNKVQKKIDELTELDRVLYDAGKKEFEKRLAPYANSIEEDNAQFQELQSGISNYLDGNSSSTANPMYRSMNVYQEPPLQKNPF